jgi:hypothetical protein
MSTEESFKLSLLNFVTEKQGIDYLIAEQTGFFLIDKETKRVLLDKLNISHSYLRSFDMVFIPRMKGIIFKEQFIETHLDELIFVELKTTKKYLPESPTGFFFGATEKEFNFGKLVGDKFKFCLVCLNPESLSYTMLTLDELDKIVKIKRIQYQINL